METFDTEVELISASLLPSETLDSTNSWPRSITIDNAESKRSLHLHIAESYPTREAVSVELKGNDIGRAAAEGWQQTISGFLDQWDPADEYPLYQLLTTHLLPLIAPDAIPPAEDEPPSVTAPPPPSIPHHALLTSHHLLSPTKRKDFFALASQLSLTGFSKVGHPGIYYAIGDEEDLAEWLREVKSWNWLALRVRLGIEPVPGGDEESAGRGKKSGARGGKGRGDWVEVEKIGEALEWLRLRGRDKLLVDIGIGASSSTD